MTRLSDALERAQTAGDTAPGSTALLGTERPDTRRDVPPSWQFDEAESPVMETGTSATAVHTDLHDDRPAEPVRDWGRFSEPTDAVAQPTETAAAPAAAEPAPDQVGRKLVIGQHDNLLIEQFRRLAAVLYHAQAQRQTRSVMIASAVPSEGKSLTATNLALTLGHSYEKRVLLIDADLRRPTLHTLFGVSNTVGLTTLLNESNSGKLPVVQVQENLWLLPAGKPDPNPTSLVTSSTMRELVREAVQEFDWVIIDTPPVGLMPDANLLAAMVDAAFVVVNAGKTPYPLVKRAVDAIGLERVLGVVLNRSERSAAAGAYTYGYYDYYAAETPKPAPGRKGLVLG